MSSFEQVSLYGLPLIFGVFFLLLKWFNNSTSQNNAKRPPPSPPTLPLIGNLHQLKGAVHKAFYAIANRYGDPNGLMLVYVGTAPSLVVSTVEAAREIMQTHDVAFADRPATRMFKIISYDFKEASMAPYGEHWKEVKGILTLHLVNTKTVQSFEAMRRRIIAGYVGGIRQSFQSNKPVDVTSILLSIANDVTCMAAFGLQIPKLTYRKAFGKTYNDGEIGRKFRKLIQEISDILGCFYFEDSIPQLAVIDVVRGVRAKVDRVFMTVDEFLTGAVEERLARTSPDPVVTEDGFTPLIDALLQIQKEDSYTGKTTIDTDVVKALLLDTYAAATASTASVMQWAMTELLRRPEIMNKAQDEVKTVLNGKSEITGEDLNKMTYLKAVIMESTRFHPPIPLLIPRVARHDVNVMGYDIAEGTVVYMNTYAIGRDPKVWDKPDEFLPERFLGSSSNIDLVRHNFQLIPFGAGRRGCPGRIYAMEIIELTLATFLNEFDWSLPQGVMPEDVDMEGTSGLANSKKVPLFAVAKPVNH